MSTPTPPPPPSTANTGIEITAKFFVLAFILNFFKPVFVIDNQPVKGAWKTPTFFPTSPGTHQVQVHFPYLFIKEAGKGVQAVNVQPGQVVRVGYKAPWLIFLPGKLTVS
ncbi:MAG: hypothetical protein ABIR32_09035 [Ilumatobacteraceae bacterium]